MNLREIEQLAGAAESVFLAGESRPTSFPWLAAEVEGSPEAGWSQRYHFGLTVVEGLLIARRNHSSRSEVRGGVLGGE
jgi:hypothetical protein